MGRVRFEWRLVALLSALAVGCAPEQDPRPPALGVQYPPQQLPYYIDASAHDDVAVVVPDYGPYPAPHPAPPMATAQGGPVLTAPDVVPIFFPNDPLQADVEVFLGELAESSYWPTVTKEYGVGPIHVSPSVIAPMPAPATTSDPDIAAWIAQEIGTKLPPLTSQRIYLVYYPQTTTISTAIGGQSCASFGGYHAEGQLQGDAGATTSFVYGVIARCDYRGFELLDMVTSITSHELAEASTDPFVDTNPAYYLVDGSDCVWDFTPGGEIGDMCEDNGGANQRLVDGFMVQRIWSNAAAQAGQDPCVPSSGVYYNAAFDFSGTVNLSAQGSTCATRGVSIPVGHSEFVNVQLFSTGEVTDWEVYAFEPTGESSLRFEWASGGFSGNNRVILSLQITRLSAGPYGGTPVYLYSGGQLYAFDGAFYPDDGNTANLWMGFIGN